jgi:methylmalonyl-CoA mutase cobalamin-binding domain/chain
MYQAIFTTPRNGRTAVVACVGGELHDLGARMVADFLEIDGWDTLYLGANTPPESIAQMAHQNHADLLCISATISSHIREVIETIAAVREHFSRQGIAILVGGHPFRIAPDLWRQVGADGYAPDAQSAAQMASLLVAL